MTQTALNDLISETEIELASNAIETFFAVYGGSNLNLFSTSELFDFRSVLACYSTMAYFAQSEPDAYAVIHETPYTFTQALQDAPSPDLEINSPIIGQAIGFLDHNQAGLPISEYLISRISQVLVTRV